MPLKLKIPLAILLLAGAALIATYRYLPVNRVAVTSELVMLGDLNGDNQWNMKDQEILSGVLADPFRFDRLSLLKIDVNRNELIDEEDTAFLEYLYRFSDPYRSEQAAADRSLAFPRPREFFKYLPTTEYVQRPLYALTHPVSRTSPFPFQGDMPFGKSAASYETRLLREVYNEALRFALAYAYREDGLTEIEKDYAREKTRHCIDLYDTRQYYPLLLNLISLVEDAETLTIRDQSDFMRKILYFRDHLQDLLVSDAFLQYQQGLIPHTAIYQIIEAALKADLDIALENFLLPGNMEDGLDKSRHWNVFGGIAIYKSPEEALVLALKRENMDLRENNFAPEAMQEFIRDTIANINGIYYVLSINPDLIPDLEGL